MRGLLLALVLAATAQAQRTGEVGFTVDQWGGLDTQHDSARISDFDAQSADNVLTDSGRLDKRTGNVRLATILAGYPNKAIREFVPASLTRYVVAHASTTVYQTDLGGTVTALSTVTANANVDMVQALNTLIVQDGQRTPWTWDATSTTSLSGMPTCKFLEYANERVYCANLPSQSTSRVAVSSYGSVSYFTVPANVSEVGEAPNTFDFQREDGDIITCLKATRLGMFVGKSRSTHIIKGYDNFTFRKEVISENIGCQDDRSVQTVDGNIVWLGQDAVYSWTGAGRPDAISRDIDPIIKSLRQGNSFSSSWVLNSEGDFEAGSLSVSGPMSSISATIAPGSITPSTWGFSTSVSTLSWTMIDVDTTVAPSSSFISNNDGPDPTLDSMWTVRDGSVVNSSHSITGATGSVDSVSTPNLVSTGVWSFVFMSSATSGYFDFWFVALDTQTTTTGGGDDYGKSYWFATGPPNGNNTFQLGKAIGSSLTILNASSGTNTTNILDGVARTFLITRSTNGFMAVYQDGSLILSATDTSATISNFTNIRLTNGRGAAHVSAVKLPGFYASQASIPYFTGISTNVFGSYTVALTSATSSSVTFSAQLSTSAIGGYNDAITATPGVQLPVTSSTQSYVRHHVGFAAPSASFVPLISAISLNAVTTGYYTSPVHFLGTAISAYGALDALETAATGGSISYAVRAGTYSFPPDTTSIAWTAVSNHATISLVVSTPTYIQVRPLFLPTSGDQAVLLDRLQVSWTDGQVSPPVSSGWKDGRYFLCATVGASSIYPDTCLVYQRNKKWVTFSGFSAASIAPYNRDLIIGSGGTDGYVWKMLQNDVYNDDGSAIASTWISKDFMFAPNGRDWAVGEKSINEVWLDTEFSSSTYLTVGYAVNKSTTYLTAPLDLGAWGESVNKLLPFTATPANGKYTRFKLYNADADKAIKVNGYSIYGEPKPKTQD